jgi:hypothetical protein
VAFGNGRALVAFADGRGLLDWTAGAAVPTLNLSYEVSYTILPGTAFQQMPGFSVLLVLCVIGMRVRDVRLVVGGLFGVAMVLRRWG